MRSFLSGFVASLSALAAAMIFFFACATPASAATVRVGAVKIKWRAPSPSCAWAARFVYNANSPPLVAYKARHKCR